MTRLLLVLLAAALLVPAAASARGGDRGGGEDRREARVQGSCGRGAAAELRLRSRDGEIALEFRVRGRRAGEAWRAVVTHERRVALRRTLRTRGSSRSARLRATVADFAGADAVAVRASGPGGIVCAADATLPGLGASQSRVQARPCGRRAPRLVEGRALSAGARAPRARPARAAARAGAGPGGAARSARR